MGGVEQGTSGGKWWYNAFVSLVDARGDLPISVWWLCLTRFCLLVGEISKRLELFSETQFMWRYFCSILNGLCGTLGIVPKMERERDF